MVPNNERWSDRPGCPCEDSDVGCLPTLLFAIGVAILIATGALSAAGVGFLLVISGVMLGLAHWSDRWRTP